MKNKLTYLIFATFILLIHSCQNNSSEILDKIIPDVKLLEEVEILEIPIIGEMADRKSEISGLCWFGDQLILLPQYPSRFNSELGKIFYIEKLRLNNFISGKDSSDIRPKYYTIDLSSIENLFTLGSGFESITIINQTVYFTIEHLDDGNTETLLISGKIDSMNQVVKLNINSLVKDPSDLNMHNISDESILHYEDKIIPIYEIFGRNINRNPQVSVFNLDLKYQSKIDYPAIEYRITDVTSVNDSGIFWAINYFYPGDFDKLNPAKDSIKHQFGLGESHLKFKHVERLVQFQIRDNEIILAKRAPIYLKLSNDGSRNWEGVVNYDNSGFLIVTDTFPKTILAFLPL